MAADAATSTTASTVTRRMILSEMMCYIQSEMNTTEHDFIVKTVVDFYSEDGTSMRRRFCCLRNE